MNKIIVFSLFTSLFAPYCCFCMKPSAEAQYRRDLAKAIAASKATAAKTAPQHYAKSPSRAPRSAQKLVPSKTKPSTAPRPAQYRPQGPTFSLKQPMNRSLAQHRDFSEDDIQRAITESLKENVQPIRATAKGLPVTHYRTNLQKGLECGFRAVLNAYAIEEIVKRGGVLSDQAIMAQETELYNRKHQEAPVTQNLTIDQVGIAAQQLGLTNLYPLGIDRNGVIYTPGNGELSIRESFELLKAGAYHMLHFVINTGGHWVVLSLIKHDANHYHIVHVDSMNGTVTMRVQPYIDYINDMMQSA